MSIVVLTSPLLDARAFVDECMHVLDLSGFILVQALGSHSPCLNLRLAASVKLTTTYTAFFGCSRSSFLPPATVRYIN